MWGIVLGILYANGAEWLLHKYLLHGLGKDKRSRWAFHWHEHHGQSRRADMLDTHYVDQGLRSWNTHTKELAGLVVAALVHAPLLAVAPEFTVTLWACAANYYRVHRKSHLDPAWGRKHLPWHYDHHMGPNQHANWCVTFPLWDHVLGTREKYLGTQRAHADMARKLARQQRTAGAEHLPDAGAKESAAA